MGEDEANMYSFIPTTPTPGNSTGTVTTIVLSSIVNARRQLQDLIRQGNTHETDWTQQFVSLMNTGPVRWSLEP